MEVILMPEVFVEKSQSFFQIVKLIKFTMRNTNLNALFTLHLFDEQCLITPYIFLYSIIMLCTIDNSNLFAG